MTRLGARVLLGAAISSGWSCVEECPQVPVALPPLVRTLPWEPAGLSVVSGRLAPGRSLPLLWDTAYPQSSLSLDGATGLDLGSVELGFDDVRVGPLSMGLSEGLEPIHGVLGQDVLHQLPLVLDAQRRETRIYPAFDPDLAGIPVELVQAGLCAADIGPARRRQAPLVVVRGVLDEQTVTLVVDTGAEVSLLASHRFAQLPGGRLLQVPVASGFAGRFLASAGRAHRVSLGEHPVQHLAWLSSPAVDEELLRLSAATKEALDGLVGWNFLREFRVALRAGQGAREARQLQLERFEMQTHWSREWIGIGVHLSAHEQPRGLRVDGFTSPSPAKDAGVLVGEVIVKINGVSAQDAPTPFTAPQQLAHLQLWSPNGQRALSVQVVDLLPDP